MQHVVVTGPLVQVINILGDQQKAVPEGLFQLRQCQMRGVRGNLRLLKLATACVIERLHQLRVAGKPLRRGDVLYMVLLPQPVGGAEGTNARFGGDPRPGQYDHSWFFHHFGYHSVSEKDALA